MRCHELPSPFLFYPHMGSLKLTAVRLRRPGSSPAIEALILLIHKACGVALIASPVWATPLMSSHSASTIWNTSAGSHW
jgi:hypothetical protein